MDLYIIGRMQGKADIIKEYHGKTKEEAKELVMFYTANYEGYICTCKTKEEAIDTCRKLNGD